jgi:hypothetical protein
LGRVSNGTDCHGLGWAAFLSKTLGNTGMKRVIFMLMMAALVAVVGCADSPDLVAKINGAYHTRFDVATPNNTTTVPSPR